MFFKAIFRVFKQEPDSGDKLYRKLTRDISG
jgi:hypothetical protein